MSSTPLRVVTDQSHKPSAGVSGQVNKRLPPWVIPALLAGALAVALAVSTLGSANPTSDMVSETRQIDDFLAKGKTSIAIGLMESTITQQNPAPSPQAKAGLARRWYIASMDELFATPSRDDSTTAQMPLKWMGIERKADAFQLPKTERLAPMTVAQRAYSAGFWPLADAAFRRAWEAGDIGIESISFRYAILRNWGHRLAFAGSPQSRDQGLRLLATAHATATAYSLPNDPACGDLNLLGYTDCNSVIPDSADPALLAAHED